MTTFKIVCSYTLLLGVILLADLFGRSGEIIIGSLKFDYNEYDYEFIIEFDNDSEPNTGEVRIYNLSQDTISKITKDTAIIVNAGYQNDTGTIFAGNIDEVIIERNDIDEIVKLNVGDATDRWLNTKVNKSYKAGIKASQILNDITSLFGLEIGQISLTNDIVYKGGKVVSGSLSQTIKSIVNDCDSKFTIVNGTIIISTKGYGRTTAVVLNSDTGLVESPTRLEQKTNDAEYKVRALLQNKVTTDSIIKVESSTLNGLCRVIRGKHIGNDNDYITEMEVITI